MRGQTGMEEREDWPSARPMGLPGSMSPRRQSWRSAVWVAVGGLAACTLLFSALVLQRWHSGPIEDIIVGVDHGNGNVFHPPSKGISHQQVLTVSKGQRDLVNEENLIREAISEALNSAEVQTRDIVKRAVKDAVAKAVSGMKEGQNLARVVESAAGHSAAVNKATSDEKVELHHISSELNKQLGGLIDDSVLNPQGVKAATAATEPAQAAASSGLKTSQQLTFDQVKAVDPALSKDQFAWLKWVENQLNGVTSSPKLAVSVHAAHKRMRQGEKNSLSESKQFRREEKILAGDAKKSMPITSSHNPKYVSSERSRDAEADKDFKMLQKRLEAKQHKDEVDHVHDDDTAVAKELEKLEEEHREKDEKALKLAAQAVKDREDRNVLAQKYLQALQKKTPAKKKLPEWKSSTVPVTSRRNPMYVAAQKQREMEAKLDLKMLNKDKVIVQKDNKVEVVKLSPILVHGVNKLSKEQQEMAAQKAAAEAAEKRRSKLALKDLKALKAHPSIGEPFHKLPLPKSLLHPHWTNMNAKATKDLAMLKKEEPVKQVVVHHINRNSLAQQFLRNLEKQVGNKIVSHPQTHQQAKTAEALAQSDLKALKDKKVAVHK